MNAHGGTLRFAENRGRLLRLTAFWVTYAVVTVFALLIYLRVLPNPDQSSFDYLAWLDSVGVPFYRGSFDMTWPGQLVFHRLYIALFGVHTWTTRAGDFILLQPAVFAIYAFTRRAGFQKAAVVAALSYPVIYVTSGPWIAGLRDMTGAHFLVAASIFALPSANLRMFRMFAAGVLVGCAVMIRPTYLAFAPIIFLTAVAVHPMPKVRPLSLVQFAFLFGTGLVSVPLLFAAYAGAVGTLDDWYLDSVRFVLDVYFVPQSARRMIGNAAVFIFKNLWWLTIIGLTGTALWLLCRRSMAALALLLGICATIFLSYFVQNKGFVYHLAGIIPVLLILACAGAEAGFSTPLRSAPIRNAAVVAVGLLLAVGTSLRLAHALPNGRQWTSQDEVLKLKLDDVIVLTKIVRAESRAEETFLQWGWEYQVSFLSQRRSPTRLVNTIAAREIRPGTSIFGAWLTEFDRELTVRKPTFILVDETVIAPDQTNIPRDAGRDTMLGILRHHLADNYAIRDRRGNATLYKRRNP